MNKIHSLFLSSLLVGFAFYSFSTHAFAAPAEQSVQSYTLGGVTYEFPIVRPSLDTLKNMVRSAKNPNEKFFSIVAEYYSPQEIKKYVDQQLEGMFEALYMPFSIDDETQFEAAKLKYSFGLPDRINSHWITEIHASLGGKKTYLSAHPSRGKKAYLSVWPVAGVAMDPKGEAGEIFSGTPFFYDLRGLWNQPKERVLGSATYKISLKPNIFDKLASKVEFKRIAGTGGEKKYRVKARDLLNAIYEAGQAFKLEDNTYRFFHYNDMDDEAETPVLSKDKKSLAFVIRTDDEDAEFYRVPFEQLSTTVTYFTFYEDQRVGLSLSDESEKLHISSAEEAF